MSRRDLLKDGEDAGFILFWSQVCLFQWPRSLSGKGVGGDGGEEIVKRRQEKKLGSFTCRRLDSPFDFHPEPRSYIKMRFRNEI